jgi:CBS domain-containing membrane protein
VCRLFTQGDLPMTCREIMTLDPPVLHPEDTVGRAFDLMLKHRYLALPVVDRDGRYLGMFAKSRLFALMLPRIVTLEEAVPRMGHVSEAAYLADEFPDLRERFDSVRNRPVGDYADASVPKVRPDSHMIEAVLAVYHTRNFVPVVDPATGRLAGVISSWDVLARIDENR